MSKIPICLSTYPITKYNAIVIRQDIPKLRKNSIPLFSSSGKTMNNAKEGITSQKMSPDKLATAAVSLVSMYIKIKAMIEMKGSEAKIAPQKLLLLAISEIKVINTAELTSFTIMYIISIFN